MSQSFFGRSVKTFRDDSEQTSEDIQESDMFTVFVQIKGTRRVKNI